MCEGEQLSVSEGEQLSMFEVSSSLCVRLAALYV